MPNKNAKKQGQYLVEKKNESSNYFYNINHLSTRFLRECGWSAAKILSMSDSLHIQNCSLGGNVSASICLPCYWPAPNVSWDGLTCTVYYTYTVHTYT